MRETTGSAVEGRVSCAQNLCSCGNSETGEACDNVSIIENGSSDDEISDQQYDDGEEEYDE